jgi:Protein of unknown function (DUF4242)
MPKYVIEREIPGAGKLSREQLQAISQKSGGVLSNLGPQIQWVESYVMDDRVHCVYIAANEELIREHARQGRLSREPDFRGPRDYRSDHCRVAVSLNGTRRSRSNAVGTGVRPVHFHASLIAGRDGGIKTRPAR